MSFDHLQHKSARIPEQIKEAENRVLDSNTADIPHRDRAEQVQGILCNILQHLQASTPQ